MNRTVFIAMLLVLCSVTSCSQIGIFSKKASMAENVNGKWLGVMEEFDGMKLTFTFNIEGDTLTGSVMSEMGEMPISNGKVTEDSFSFDVDAGGQVISQSCTYADGIIT
ncbi:hypothetical protein ACFL50_07335, partial [Candidatus Latescibacterota bacterium]